MIKKRAISLFILVLIIIGCDSDTSTGPRINFNGTFQLEALNGNEINELQKIDDKLFAATAHGLVAFSLQDSFKEIDTFRQQNIILSFLFLNKNNWLISAESRTHYKENKILKSTNQGKSWFPFDNGFGAPGSFVVPWTLVQSPRSPSTIYAMNLLSIYKSVDSGRSWKRVYKGERYGEFNFFKINSYKPSTLYAGGSKPYAGEERLGPRLVKTEDEGQTWQEIELFIANLNPVPTDILFLERGSEHNIIITAFRDDYLIRKSKDGGKNWYTVSEDDLVPAQLTQSPRNERVIFSAGSAGDYVYFGASEDWGETWKVKKVQRESAVFQVNDIISLIVNDRLVLYLATNNGIYSYTFK